MPGNMAVCLRENVGLLPGSLASLLPAWEGWQSAPQGKYGPVVACCACGRKPVHMRMPHLITVHHLPCLVIPSEEGHFEPILTSDLI